jgi:cell division protease FtsH
MTHLLMFASSTRPLAEVLVDALRAGTKLRLPKLQKGSSNAAYEQPQFDLRKVGDLQDPLDTDEINILRPDEVAVAWLLGRTLDGQRDALARMQDADAATIIEVPNQDFVDHVERLLKMHVIAGAPTLDGDSLGKDDTIAAPHTVAILTRKDEDKPKTSKSSENGNAEFAVAVQRRCAVVGITADPDRLLPPNLVRMAEHRFVVPPLDASAVAAVIEAVTGRRPGAIDDELARRTTLEALNIAVRADLGAERSLARLTRLLESHTASAEPALLLSQIHGLGAAQDWGLALIRDLHDYEAGRLPWAAVDKGCLLTGLPGTGKTSFARAIAREAKGHFVATSYAQWQSHRDGHLGHVTQAIRNAFAEARRNSPSILFIDEIDSVPRRGTGKWNDD